MHLTDEQLDIKKDVLKWHKSFLLNQHSRNLNNEQDDNLDYGNPHQWITIGGFAGTGKTVLLADIVRDLSKKRFSIACCCYTGKAASVLKSKLEDYDVAHKVEYIGTIHSLIYQPIFTTDLKTNKKVISGWDKKTTIPYDIIVIDEASMVNYSIFDDLKSYNKPMIAVGDSYQLPPINDKDKDKNSEASNFNLMINPKYNLTTIHRQALNNPIIKLSINARLNGFINYGIYSKDVFKLSWTDPRTVNLFKSINFDPDTIALCGFNKTRVELNDLVRKEKKFTNKFPYTTERVICLKNNHDTKIMNGQLGTILWSFPKDDKTFDMTIEMDSRTINNDDDIYSTLAHRDCFLKVKYDDIWDEINANKWKKKYKHYNSIDFFDYGYVISVHKSQGSEWNRVVLFEQRPSFWSDDYWKRWLYTAVTRAKEKLFIVGNYW